MKKGAKKCLTSAYCACAIVLVEIKARYDAGKSISINALLYSVYTTRLYETIRNSEVESLKRLEQLLVTYYMR